MKITIYENYTADPESELLGYMGETNARTIEVKQPDVEDADTYRLRFEYSDGVVYDVPITDNKVIITASLLREVGKINCQWIATKSNGETFDLVAKSQIFELRIGKSIGDDVAPIPTYEQSVAALDKLLALLAAGSSGGENGATFTPTVSSEGVLSWTNDKGLSNPEPVNIKGPKGEQGERGSPGEKGADGKDGQDGYTPVKGVDYGTDEDKQEIKAYINAYIDSQIGSLNTALENRLNGGVANG